MDDGGLECILVPCKCGLSFLARAVAGEHQCPDCGNVVALVEEKGRTPAQTYRRRCAPQLRLPAPSIGRPLAPITIANRGVKGALMSSRSSTTPVVGPAPADSSE